MLIFQTYLLEFDSQGCTEKTILVAKMNLNYRTHCKMS